MADPAETDSAAAPPVENALTRKPAITHENYWLESTRPLVSLAFVAPLLVLYELGVLWLGPHAMRNGVDIWLRQFLETLGFGQYFLLPALTCAILLAWHHAEHQQWRFHGRVLSTMFVECLLLAMILVVVAHMQGSFLAAVAPQLRVAIESEELNLPTRLIGYCGAGIYEELLFRLMLLPCVAMAIRSLGFSWRISVGVSVVLTSVLFSAAHYEPFSSGGYELDWYSFLFRFSAGAFFSILFVYRGFGIAAGAHAIYDMLVEIV